MFFGCGAGSGGLHCGALETTAGPSSTPSRSTTQRQPSPTSVEIDTHQLLDGRLLVVLLTRRPRLLVPLVEDVAVEHGREDEHDGDQTNQPAGDLEEEREDLRSSQNQDGVVRPVAQVAKLRGLLVLHARQQVHGRRTHEERADTQATHDDERILRDRQSTRHAVEREGHVLELQRDEDPEGPPSGALGGSVLGVAGRVGHALDDHVRDEADHAREQHRLLVLGVDGDAQHQHDDGRDDRGDVLDLVPRERELALQPREPVDPVVVLHEEERRSDHEQVDTTEDGDLRVGGLDVLRVGGMVGEGQVHGVAEAHVARDRDDQDREHEPHEAGRERDADGHEDPLPPGREQLEQLHVDHGVVTREGDLDDDEQQEQRKNADPEEVGQENRHDERDSDIPHVVPEQFHVSPFRELRGCLWAVRSEGDAGWS